MFLPRRRSSEVSDSQDPEEVTVTCFGGKKKGKKSSGVLSGILEEAEGLIKDLRQEVSELRHAQSGKSDEVKRLEESVTRLIEEKEKLWEEKGRLREEVTGLRVENSSLEQRAERMASENHDLKKEIRACSQDLDTGLKSANEEQRLTSKMADSLKVECQEVKTSLLKTRTKLEQTSNELKTVLKRYEDSQSDIERLTRDLSNLEMSKLMTENELRFKMTAVRRKYTDLKRLCRGKDVLVSRLREEKSRSLMQLWQMTYGQSSKIPPCLDSQSDRPKPLPMAAVEPFHYDVINVCTSPQPVKEQDQVDHLNVVSLKVGSQNHQPLLHTEQVSPEFLKNKTMSLEFELYRQRIMADIFDGLSVSDGGENTSEANFLSDDASEGVSDYIDSVLGCVMEKNQYETGSSFGSVSSELIL